MCCATSSAFKLISLLFVAVHHSTIVQPGMCGVQNLAETCAVQVLVDDVLCRVGAGWWSGVSAQLSV